MLRLQWAFVLCFLEVQLCVVRGWRYSAPVVALVEMHAWGTAGGEGKRGTVVVRARSVCRLAALQRGARGFVVF